MSALRFLSSCPTSLSRPRAKSAVSLSSSAFHLCISFSSLASRCPSRAASSCCSCPQRSCISFRRDSTESLTAVSVSSSWCKRRHDASSASQRFEMSFTFVSSSETLAASVAPLAAICAHLFSYLATMSLPGTSSWGAVAAPFGLAWMLSDPVSICTLLIAAVAALNRSLKPSILSPRRLPREGCGRPCKRASHGFAFSPLFRGSPTAKWSK
mmetsp:Transcript_29136/g.73838  ORF Transcript_29136/g.73838 Transcript_29136/m.73838 type:complete len:212 (+) Transcript_29136:495-1130(+)